MFVGKMAHALTVFKQDMLLIIAIERNDSFFTAKVYTVLCCVAKYKDSS